MATHYTTCKHCDTKLIVDDGNCYPGGLKDYEAIFCPSCGKDLPSVYTSSIPHVYYDTAVLKKNTQE